MLETCSNDETLVILAHELGHVEHRHALRNVLQELGVSALAGVLSTDASSLSMSATALPFVLASAHYSQAFERDADADGFRLARQAGWSPELFASCLQKISEDFGDERRAMTYTSSHPPSFERIQAAQDAAAGFKPWRGLETDAPADAADADEPADAGDAGEPDAE
jgi:predicted Zn-dependent protease